MLLDGISAKIGLQCMCESDVGAISQSPTRICQVLSFNRCLTFAKMILIHKNVKQPGLMVKCA